MFQVSGPTHTYPAPGGSTPMYTPGSQPTVNYPIGQPMNASGYGAGWQQPGTHAGMRAPAVSAGMGQQLALAALFGLIAAVLGALAWAFFLNATKTNFYILGVVLGWIVGFAVMLGARRQRHVAFAVLAGVLGLGCFVLALYFRLSLLFDGFVGDNSVNVFALPFGLFLDVLKVYMKDNQFIFINFVAVPLVAVLTARPARRRR